MNYETNPPAKSASDLADFQSGQVTLHVSREKDGKLRLVYARIERCQGRPAWRGARAAMPRRYEFLPPSSYPWVPSVARHARPSTAR